MRRPETMGPSRCLVALVLCAGVMSAWGCDFDDAISVRIGSLVVTTVTTGTNPDPDGYQLRVTGPSFDVTQAIGVNDSATFVVVGGRGYTATLSDLAAGCAAVTNPQTVTVPTNGSATVTFSVSCS